MQRFTAYLAVVCAAGALAACSANGNGSNSNSTGGSSSGKGGAGQGGSANGGTPAMGGAANGGAPAMGGAASGGAAMGGAANGGAAMGGSASGGAASGGAATGGSSSGGGANGGAATGGGAGTAGNAGSGGGGTVELKMPIQRNGKYVLEFGDVLLEVDPASGGRVITFSLGGKNVLTHDASTDLSNGGNYGSIFWPSPQSAWGTSNWPPIPEIDNQAYTASLDGNTIVMTQGMTSARSKLSVVKKFTAVLNAQAVDIQYTLTNKDTAAASWAPWQLARVPLSGLTLFPTGTSVVNITNGLPTSKVMNQDSVSWYKNASGDAGKYAADGKEGWFAHVTGDVLFVNRFTDVAAAQQAPGEGECEFYAGMGYEELEIQGAYGSIAPNASVNWTVRWYLRPITDTSIVAVGNAALVTMVRDTVKQ